MTLACMIDGPIAPQVCRKIPFASAEELRWHLTRAHGAPVGQIYRCPLSSCGQFHYSQQSRVERKRLIKGTRKRLGLTGASSPSDSEQAAS